MSLVSEALKKAEREAAARDARAKGAPAPVDAPLQPYRARGGGRGGRSQAPRWALIGGLGLIAALAVGWWSSARKAPVKVVEAESSERLAVPRAPAAAIEDQAAPAGPATPEARQGQAPAGSAVAAATAQAPSSASEPPATPPARLPLPKTTQQPSPASPSVSEPRTPQLPPPPAPKAPASKPSNGSGDYLRKVEFADGSALELGGIVYSEAAPFAYLNGRMVGVGEFVLGRRIDRIERDHVVLTGDDGTIVLRLKPN